MAISPIELNGTISRAQDISVIKHNEDNKGLLDQTNFQTRFNKEIDQRMARVNESDRSEYQNKKFDAKEKSDNTYYGDGGNRRKDSDKEKEKQKDGVVIHKMNGGMFDMKV